MELWDLIIPCSTTAHLRKGQMFPTRAVLNRQDLKLEGHGSFIAILGDS